MTKQHHQPEFSHRVAVDKIPAGGLKITLTANEVQRAALKERFDLVDLQSLSAELKVKRESHVVDEVIVTGTLTAEATQQCVVTLEPLPISINTSLRIICLDESAAPSESSTIDLVHDDDDIDYIQNGQIDLGELIAQHFGITLDPYPRKPGLDPISEEPADDGDKPENPFAKLASLKNKPKKD